MVSKVDLNFIIPEDEKLCGGGMFRWLLRQNGGGNGGAYRVARERCLQSMICAKASGKRWKYPTSIWFMGEGGKVRGVS